MGVTGAPGEPGPPGSLLFAPVISQSCDHVIAHMTSIVHRGCMAQYYQHLITRDLLML